ncbi:Protein kinase domain family protein [Aspergillus niger]|uniref:Protein kinase domain family protein n=1 Tax=Aspergillus niger TaxID=5061 RepID=A0A505HX54_ASPNG|nr:Protein kinase domain family protein [Aspergillus niger]
MPNPQPSTAILASLAASLLAIRARPPPSRPSLPRRLASPSHLANWSIPFASTHAATLRGHRTPACLAPAVAAILRANVLWSEVIRGGRPRPPRPGTSPAANWSMAFVAHEGRTAPCLIPLESSQRDADPFRPRLGFSGKSNGNWRMKLVEEKEEGPLAHGRESIQRPSNAGAAGL